MEKEKINLNYIKNLGKNRSEENLSLLIDLYNDDLISLDLISLDLKSCY